MKPGMPFKSPWGRPGDVMYIPELTTVQGALAVRVRPRIGYSGYFGVMIDGVLTGVKYCADDADQVFIGPHDAEGVEHHVSVIPFGRAPGAIGYYTGQHTAFEDSHARRLRITTTVAPQVFVIDRESRCNSWAISGFNRLAQNVDRTADNPRLGTIDVSIVYTGTVTTVTLTAGGRTIAQGTHTWSFGELNPLITLLEQNGSGVAGSVNCVAAVGAYSSTARIYVRWPAKINEHYSTSPLSFPRAAEGDVPDDGWSNTLTYRSGEIEPGNYNVVSRLVDDNGNQGTNTTPTTVIVPGPPDPAGALIYVSGDASGTTISWGASATPGCQYNIYDSGMVDPAVDSKPWLALDDAPLDTVSGTSYTLPALADLTYTGKRRVLVRATTGVYEEANTAFLEIEYVNGVRLAPRPNAPVCGVPPTFNGRTLTVRYTYRTANQKVAPVEFTLAAWDANGPADYTPLATETALAPEAGIITGTISATVGADGLYAYNVRAVSDEGVDDGNTISYGPVVLTTAAEDDPVNTVAEARY